MAFLGYKSSPVLGAVSPSIDLEYVNRRLESFAHDPSPSRPTILYPASPPCPSTPPFPNPMIPSTFFRHWASHKAKELQSLEPTIDHRLSIDDIEYWRTEARCYTSSLGALAEQERQNIDEWMYWRTEATFWRQAFYSKDRTTDRWDIQNLQYWKTEALRLAKAFENNPQTSNIRWHICDWVYWRTETFHYDDRLEQVMRQNLALKDLPPKSALQQSPNCKKRKAEDDGVGRPISSWLAKWNAVHKKPSGDITSSF
ncbi:hypothetical protein ABEF95_009053 [Exophiala dermatitidis]